MQAGARMEWHLAASRLDHTIRLLRRYPGHQLTLSRTRSRSVEDYFITYRKLPWWIIGFADVAGYTGGGQGFLMIFFLSGFAGLWLMAWISWVIWMPLVAILWARWWRRLGVPTTGEFIERRYGGRRAAVYPKVYAVYACVVSGLTSLGYGAPAK
jgi:SSS family solute:Na+ symporter